MEWSGRSYGAKTFTNGYSTNSLLLRSISTTLVKSNYRISLHRSTLFVANKITVNCAP
jgi:hypothetical protein